MPSAIAIIWGWGKVGKVPELRQAGGRAGLKRFITRRWMEKTPFASLVGSMALAPLGYGSVDSSVVPTRPARHLHQRHGAMRCDVMRCGEGA